MEPATAACTTPGDLRECRFDTPRDLEDLTERAASGGFFVEGDGLEDLLFTPLTEVRKCPDAPLLGGPLEVGDRAHPERLPQRTRLLRAEPLDGGQREDIDRCLLPQLFEVGHLAGLEHSGNALGDALADPRQSVERLLVTLRVDSR
jgi:hypothetical protein